MLKLIKFIKKVSPRTNRAKDIFLGLLFPRFCVGCNEEGSFLCSKCVRDIVPVVSQVCPECGKLSERSMYHESCSKGKALKGIIAAAYFEEGPVREMIHNLKYNGVIELKDKLAELMVDAFLQCHSRPVGDRIGNLDPRCRSSQNSDRLEDDNIVVTFTPLHWHRQATRGYNQSELLAQEISRRLDIPVIDTLTKIKGTKRQVELKGEARRKNLKGLFRVKNNIDIKDRTIIIVDDVYTTGSTLNECASVLRAAGAKEVWGLVVARG